MSTAEGPLQQGPAVQTTVIRPSTGWVSLRLGEIWQYRELLYFFVWRDVKVRYKQTAFGALWAIIQPLALMVVFTVVFSRLGGIAPGSAVCAVRLRRPCALDALLLEPDRLIQ